MFVTFEGIEGSSKTTQAGLLSEWLKEHSVGHLLTKEPGSVISKERQQIRSLLLNPENNLSPKAELFLYLADRAQHVQKYIIPRLKNNEWVVSDRYWLSTYVYQGYGRGFIEEENLESFTELVLSSADHVMPDITFVMDLPVEVGLERARGSNKEFKGGDRMELEDIEFHRRLREGFLIAAADDPERCIVLDATKSIKELHEEVKKVLQNEI